MKENIAKIKKLITSAAEKVGRDPNEIILLAVSKRKPVSQIDEAVALGQLDFGENYLQDAKEKISALGDNITWHFIGHIQSNKAKLVAELFDTVHTIDRLKVAIALEKRLASLNKVMPVYVQVNISKEEQKSGVSPEEMGPLVREILNLPHLSFAGLMAMPPYATDPEKSRPYFRSLRILAEELVHKKLTEQSGKVGLSMGMSGDFEVAVEEGATVVRVGTAIFGARI